MRSGGSTFVTGYTRFFDLLNYQYLTQQRRKDMNELIDFVNNKIKEAVERAGLQFVLVKCNAYCGLFQGRYCLPGIQEPSLNRADLLFYLASGCTLRFRPSQHLYY